MCKTSSSGNLGHVSQSPVALVGQREAVQLKEGVEPGDMKWPLPTELPGGEQPHSSVTAMCGRERGHFVLLPSWPGTKFLNKKILHHMPVFSLILHFCGVQVTSMFPGAYSVVFVPS